MNPIQIFNNSEFGALEVRLIDGKPYFPAVECAKQLGYTKPHNAIERHCRYSLKQGVPHPQSPEKTIEKTFIPESDLLRLIIRSKLPAAVRFETWVFEEVLPSILYTGAYQAPGAPGPGREKDPCAGCAEAMLACLADMTPKILAAAKAEEAEEKADDDEDTAEWVTAQEAAAILGLSAHYTRELAASGFLPHKREPSITGKRVRIKIPVSALRRLKRLYGKGRPAPQTPKRDRLALDRPQGYSIPQKPAQPSADPCEMPEVIQMIFGPGPGESRAACSDFARGSNRAKSTPVSRSETPDPTSYWKR